MNKDNLGVSNYCACFIDLLGQRIALQGQGLMPALDDEISKQKFLEIVHESVRKIENLQKQAERLTKSEEPTTSIRDQLTPEQQSLYDEMASAKPKQQRWSDGLVFYSSLSRAHSQCPMNAVHKIFFLSGALCLVGLAEKQPIRGAIEVAWGQELHNNELYGAVVANSYILESSIAQYPRIVIGPATMEYLKAFLQYEHPKEDTLAIYNKKLAESCLDMTAIDQDGHYILDYLGQTYKNEVFHGENNDFYSPAYQYICEQYETHKSAKDSKLAMRYAWLKSYFDQNKTIHT